MPKVTRKKLLSRTRPKHVSKNEAKWSSQKTRTIIRTHHQLHKRLTQAKSANNDANVNHLQGQIEDLGGLSAYQRASTIGQGKERGGDTSKVLMQWFNELKSSRSVASRPATCGTAEEKAGPSYRMLEVGCLKVDNACAQSGLFAMKRIDLQSQHPDIDAQDFMLLQPPVEEERHREGYDLISLSLVLNYVGDATERGDMLRHADQFLRDASMLHEEGSDELTPGVFVVLPGPCLTNSRYLQETKFVEIMSKLGYALKRKKYSGKLAYLLWKKVGPVVMNAHVPKREILGGAARNNFAIVLKANR